jgi:hypothetical protein
LSLACCPVVSCRREDVHDNGTLRAGGDGVGRFGGDLPDSTRFDGLRLLADSEDDRACAHRPKLFVLMLMLGPQPSFIQAGDAVRSTAPVSWRASL